MFSILFLMKQTELTKDKGKVAEALIFRFCIAALEMTPNSKGRPVHFLTLRVYISGIFWFLLPFLSLQAQFSTDLPEILYEVS